MRQLGDGVRDQVPISLSFSAHEVLLYYTDTFAQPGVNWVLETANRTGSDIYGVC